MELLNFYEHWTGVLWPSPRSISCTFDFAAAVSFFFNRLVLMYLVVHFLCSNKKCAFCIDCFLFPAVTLVWDLNLHQQPAWLDFELLNFESQSWKSERSATAVLTKHSKRLNSKKQVCKFDQWRPRVQIRTKKYTPRGPGGDFCYWLYFTVIRIYPFAQPEHPPVFGACLLTCCSVLDSMYLNWW